MKTLALPLTLLALGLIVLSGVLILKPFNQATGAGYIGWSTYLQSATTTTVGPSAGKITIFAAKDDNSCKARVITTNYGGIFLIFGDATGFSSTTIANGVGHWQPASTTVAYESGIYGCGRWTGYATASTSITISEF